MAKKTTLTAVTPVGTFTRTTATPYTHIVVWNSSRAMDVYRKHLEFGTERSGVDARWVKDHGFGVTWHTSERTARAAACKPYTWEAAATHVGVFPVMVGKQTYKLSHASDGANAGTFFGTRAEVETLALAAGYKYEV